MTKIIFVHGMNANELSWNGLERHPDITRDWPDTAAITLKGHDERAFSPGDEPDTETLGGCESFLLALKKRPRLDPSMADYIASVVAAFPSAPAGVSEPKDVCLVGHSMGGAVISHVASAYWERVDRLIYLSAMLPSEGDTIKDLTAAIAVTGPVLPNSICAEFGAYMPEIAPALVKQPEGPKLEEFKPSTGFAGVNKHYVRCMNDKLIPPGAQKFMLDKHPPVKQEELPTGHLPQYEDQAALVKLIANILT